MVYPSSKELFALAKLGFAFINDLNKPELCWEVDVDETNMIWEFLRYNDVWTSTEESTEEASFWWHVGFMTDELIDTLDKVYSLNTVAIRNF